MSIFVVDSNFFIEAHRATYPLDVARGFWNKIQQLAADQRLISIDKVKAELFDNHEDELKEWCEASLPIDFLPFVSEATQKLTRQRKTITADKIVAELNFGFWNRLFSRNYTSILWKPLRVIFQNTPKKQRQRDTIADSLYRIRTLRNRIYHYEPIFGNLQEIDEIHTEMLTFLNWLDKDLPNLISDINRFEEILNKAKNI